MGAWSVDTFGNDDASDWVYELERSQGVEILQSTLRRVTAQKGELMAPACSEALAAAEVVAALRGKPGEELPDEVNAWVQGRARPDDALQKDAVRAIERILAQSELRELWEETDEFSAWQACVAELRARLEA